MKINTNILWYSLLIITTLLGLYGITLQSVEGHSVTGISKLVPWGIYIPAFTFFMGISTGCTVVGFIIHVFNRGDLRSLELKASILSLVTLIGGLLFLLSDVGDPIRLLKVPFLLHNTSSIFFYSSLSYYAFGALLIYQIISLAKLCRDITSESLQRRVRVLSIVLFPVAMILVLVPDGALFSFISTRSFWNKPLLLVQFANASLASGIAVLLLVGYISSKINNRTILTDKAKELTGYLLAFLTAGLLFLNIIDIMVLRYSDGVQDLHAWELLTHEHLLLFLSSILGLVIALVVLIGRNGKSLLNLAISSILIIVAVSAYRYNLIIVGQEIPLLGEDIVEKYTPTFVEILVCTGITSLTILMYQFVLRYSNLKPIPVHNLK